MAELVVKTPCGGWLPLTLGDLHLEEIDPGRLSLITRLGPEESVSARLQDAHGLDWPAPNRMTGTGDSRCIWFGRNQALLMGPAPDATLAGGAAVVDQSDGWCAVVLKGADVEDALARLVPVDLRARCFAVGQTARSQVGHMPGSISRIGADSFLILVFRSMASTLIEELERAMRGVTTRR